MITRRAFSSSLLGWACCSIVARAQSYPPSQVRMIVPFPPGGATDVLGRVVGQQLQALWGNVVVIENKPGAAGLVGSKFAMGQPADGTTLLLASTGSALAVATEAPAQGAFDICNTLAPVSLMAAPPYILTVNPKLPVKTTADLIAYVKANPGKLSYGSSGVGSASHMSGALFARMAGIDMVHVPYRGTGPAVTDLLGGRIELMFAPAPVVIAHIAAGTLLAIGTTGAERSGIFPDIPTVAETGLQGYESVGWFGIFAPKDTPAATVTRISADVGKVMRADEVRKRLADEGAEPAPSTPQAFTAFVNADIAKWLDLAQKAGIVLGH